MLECEKPKYRDLIKEDFQENSLIYKIWKYLAQRKIIYGDEDEKIL